jgi:hypothetical protein
MALADLTRPQWGGPNSDVDLHIEEHLGIVDASFQYASKFAAWTNIRNLRGTNTIRVDRIGSSTIAGRKAGEDLNITKVKSDKFNLTVDTVLYARHQFDKFDDWTASLDMRKEVAKEDGIALARQYDQACLIQLQKAGDFVAPLHLKDAFHDGILLPATISLAVADAEASADLLVREHRKGVEAFVNRDLGDQLISEGVTVMTPQIFSLLLEHKRLMNVEFGAGEGNSFVGGRIAMLNGVKVVETPRFATGAVTTSPLGEDYNLTATQAKRVMITFIPSLALVSAQVHPVSADYWEWKEKFCHVLDTFQSYAIGARRPDAVACHEVTFTGP